MVLEAILPLGHLGVIGADVLEEEQSTVGLEHAGDLGQGTGGIGDRAKDKGGDDGVEAGVGKRQLLTIGVDDLGAAVPAGQRALELMAHLRVRLG